MKIAVGSTKSVLAMINYHPIKTKKLSSEQLFTTSTINYPVNASGRRERRAAAFENDHLCLWGARQKKWLWSACMLTELSRKYASADT